MDPREHAEAWLAAWNAHDLDAIMACYSDDVDFSAPPVTGGWERADGRLRGKSELRRHFRLGLGVAPDLAFTEEALLIGAGGYALVYHRENGSRAIDVVELDDQGRAARVRAFYEEERLTAEEREHVSSDLQ